MEVDFEPTFYNTFLLYFSASIHLVVLILQGLLDQRLFEKCLELENQNPNGNIIGYVNLQIYYLLYSSSIGCSMHLLFGVLRILRTLMEWNRTRTVLATPTWGCSIQGLFIWAEVISVTEKTFRQVYKRDLALL